MTFTQRKRFAAVVLPFFLAGTGAYATTWYVGTTNCSDCTGGSCGSSSTPWCTIAYAIAHASNGDTIIVKDGTYTEHDLDFGGKAITIQSQNGPQNCTIDCNDSGRAFYFHTSETSSSIVDGFTILDGNTQDEGGGIRCEAASPQILDCVFESCTAAHGGAISLRGGSDALVQDCTFTGNSTSGYGGAVDVYDNSDPDLIGLVIDGTNTADSGGGINVYQADATITGCEITGVTVTGSGGGIYIYSAPTGVTLTDCTISGCSASNGVGGAVRLSDSEVGLTDCVFTENDANSDGGGIYGLNASVSLDECTIGANTSSGSGGGIYLEGDGANTWLSATDTDFTGNTAANEGGGLYEWIPSTGSVSNITRCAFTNNEAGTKGGGIRIRGYPNWGGDPTVIVNLSNCLIADNTVASSSGGKGGGAYIYKAEAPFVNCTISGNEITGSSPEGGALYIEGLPDHNDIDLRNSIVWNNTTPQFETQNEDTTINVSYSDVDLGEDHLVDGGGNIDNEDPMFAESFELGDYRLSRGSPCIDAAKSCDCTGDCDDGDLVMAARKVDHICTDETGDDCTNEDLIDMGCYEAFGGVVYVDKDATGDDNGLSWADAYDDLQDGFSKAGNPETFEEWDPAVCEIWVAEGSYKPDDCTSCSSYRTSTFALVEGVGIYGGFDGTETARSQRDPQDNETILTGLIGSPGLTRVYHVVTAADTITDATEFDGFTVKLGRSDGGGTDQDKGAGLYIDGSPTLKQLIVSDNLGDHGAGVYIKSGNSTFTDCAFVDNNATDAGGGVGTGGAVYIASGGSGSIEFLRCNFNNNLALDKGGGVYTDSTGAEPHFTNCLFYRNDANKSDTDTRGGAIYTNRKVVLLQCTFGKNWCGEDNMGGAVYNAAGNSVLKNCVLWKNYSTSSEHHDSEDDQIKIASGSVTATFTTIENIDSLSGGQNSGVNPRYKNFSSDDFELDPVACGDHSCTSTSIDQGEDDDCTGLCDTGGGGDSGGDVKKRTRKINLDNRSDLIDRGALETQSGP
ncbi:MAG: hypothetical protein EDS66_16630 [Planctomycetota bacterium]|nr:MAG: hypothetical protein EDS66_16630 [Planctomycetota bacterium]